MSRHALIVIAVPLFCCLLCYRVSAETPEHSSFQPMSRPQLPAVENTQWIRNPIDRFVLRRLEQANIHPSTVADRTTLIRRVTLDLTGLLPTPEEVDA